jgi:hypothetical protein
MLLIILILNNINIIYEYNKFKNIYNYYQIDFNNIISSDFINNKQNRLKFNKTIF